MMNTQTIKEFMEGTPKNYTIEITEGTNDNILYRGTFGKMPEKYNNNIVTSWDAVEMADSTIEIGIMI